MRSARRRNSLVTAAALLAAAYTGWAPASGRAQTIALDRLSHIHGVVVDPSQPSRLYLATHEGLFAAGPDGLAVRVGDSRDDLMSFAAHPGDPNSFFASGHPLGGGNLGVLASTDRGLTWRRISAGASGPVDFHAMAVSAADPSVVYGVYKGMQVSQDGGRTWRIVGRAPPDLFGLAASARAVDTVYAATRGGLLVSRDGGKTWAFAYILKRPATMVHATASGRVYAFVYGVGLIATDEPSLNWRPVSNDFVDRYLVHLAVDPNDADRLYAVADTGTVVTSKDGGKTWTSFEGSNTPSPETVAAGERLYEENCRSCHGVRGVGERPDDMYARDEYGFVAPPLDDSAHGWHHSDANLVDTILNGSPRNPRMAGHKDALSREDAAKIVTYIKSLWNFRSLACQGAKHMACM